MTERTYTWTDAEPRERLAEIMAKAKQGDKFAATGDEWRIEDTVKVESSVGVVYGHYASWNSHMSICPVITAFTLTTDEPDEPDEPWWKGCRIVMDGNGEAWQFCEGQGWDGTAGFNRHTEALADLSPITPLVKPNGDPYLSCDVRQRTAAGMIRALWGVPESVTDDDLVADTRRSFDKVLAYLDAEFGIDGEPH